APRLDDTLLVLLLFSDPSVLGFLFVGVLVLYERGSNTLSAVAVTPLATGHYLWSKAISLTTLATAAGLAMALAARGASFDPFRLVAALALTSLVFVFLGFVAVVRVRTVNEYLLIVPAFMAPLYLPLLSLAGMAESAAFLLVPSHASLLLFRGAFAPRPLWEAIYGVGFLALTVAIAYRWAHRSFETFVRGAGGPPARTRAGAPRE
ncbi:MAG: hypothetical protein Q8Q14_13490, partial [Gemmatimonadales bacterium]|nr:hypothetical protein [Gemmatimonadales bacterium]